MTALRGASCGMDGCHVWDWLEQRTPLPLGAKCPVKSKGMPLYSACLLMVQDADEPKANAANDKSPDKKPRASKKATGKCSTSFCARLGFCLWCSQVVCALPASSVMNQMYDDASRKIGCQAC